MRTRARAWAIRAVVVAVITAAGTVGVATPAYAAPMIVNFTLSTNTIDPGQQVTARWTVRTNDADGEVVDVSISSNNPQVQCTGGDCNVIGAQVTQTGRDFEAVFTASGAFANQQTVQIRVTAGGVQSNPANLTVRATPTVPEVRGTVTDVYTGDPVKDARVGMVDSTGQTWDNIGTGADGSFVITSTPQKPIAAGTLRFSVRKEGVKDYDSGPYNGVPNQPLLNVSLRVEVLPSTSPTTAPSITATDLATETAGTTTSAAAAPDTGLSGFAIMMIIIGGVLVLVGIGAIVLLFLRRNNDDDEDGPPGYGGPGGPGGRGPGRGGPPPGQRRPGPPDRTQPMRPPGYGGGPRPVAPGARDQTMIARSPLADAPTQLHGRPGAPQPPYGGPPPGGYPPQPPAPGGGWASPAGGPPPGGPPPGGYGPPPQFGGPPAAPPPPAPPAYGPGQPGYGQPRPAPGGYQDPRHAARPTGEGRRVDWMDD